MIDEKKNVIITTVIILIIILGIIFYMKTDDCEDGVVVGKIENIKSYADGYYLVELDNGKTVTISRSIRCGIYTGKYVEYFSTIDKYRIYCG